MTTRNEYQKLFDTRKWKLALSFLPLNTPVEIKVKNPNDLLALRARASDYAKENGDLKVSVRNLDFDKKTATVEVTKKEML